MFVDRDTIEDGFETVVDLAWILGINAPSFDDMIDYTIGSDLECFADLREVEIPSDDIELFECDGDELFLEFSRQLYGALPDVPGVKWLGLDEKDLERCDMQGFGRSFIPVRVRVDWGELFGEWTLSDHEIIDDGRAPGSGFYRTCGDERWVIQTALTDIFELDQSSESLPYDVMQSLDAVSYCPNLLAWMDRVDSVEMGA